METRAPLLPVVGRALDSQEKFAAVRPLLNGSGGTEAAVLFINDHVEVVRIGDTTVVLVNQEHQIYTDYELPHLLTEMIGSLGQRERGLLVLEYFEPELFKNAGRIPGLRGIFKLSQKVWGYVSRRVQLAEKLASVAASASVPVAVLDIASTPEFEFHKRAPLWVSVAALTVGRIRTSRTLRNAAMLTAGYFGVMEVAEYAKKLIFEPHGVTPWDRVLFHIEDARRIISANLLRKVAANGHDIVMVVQPEVHNHRLKMLLTDSDFTSRALAVSKRYMYPLILAGLPFYGRVWTHDGTGWNHTYNIDL